MTDSLTDEQWAAIIEANMNPYAAANLPAQGRRARVLARLTSAQGKATKAGHPQPLQVGYSTGGGPRYIVPGDELHVNQADPSMHLALQDLADQIVVDLTEACRAFDDPDLWYPGVDEGITPVTDEHVELVIWASQRELNREMRYPRGARTDVQVEKRPAAPLSDLPWRIQRAFAERRRLRYQQWGIGRKEWAENAWWPLSVPEDPEWAPSEHELSPR